MSKIWGLRLALAGLIALVFAGLTTVYLAWNYQTARNEYLRYRETAETASRQSAKDMIAGCKAPGFFLLPLEFRRFRECLEEGIISSQKRSASIKELEAQQSMAVSAEWSVILSLVNIIVSIFGIAGLLCSLWLNLRATKVAEQSVEDNRKFTWADQRPWLYVDTGKIYNVRISEALPNDVGHTHELRFAMPIEISNSGKSPAHDVSFFHKGFSSGEAWSAAEQHRNGKRYIHASDKGSIPPSATKSEHIQFSVGFVKPPDDLSGGISIDVVLALDYKNTRNGEILRTVQIFTVGKDTDHPGLAALDFREIVNGTERFRVSPLGATMT